MFSTMLFICIIQWPPPVVGTGTVLRGHHKMTKQGILAGWRRMGRQHSKTEIPELATLSEASMKLPSCGAHSRSRAGFGAVLMLQHSQI